ncbi:MAG TPA: hypothetical protein VFB45_16125 [Pseudolabrys sp.]|nr:hypothetical protein [Pseudolabrys sp.]
MKLNVLAIALAVSAFTTLGAGAQTVIEERRDPGVVIEKDRPAPSVTIEKRDAPVVEKKTKVETTGSGCDSKTVHKEGPEGSKTVKKTEC